MTASTNQENRSALRDVKHMLEKISHVLRRQPRNIDKAAAALEKYLAEEEDDFEEILGVFDALDRYFILFRDLAIEELPKLAEYWHRLEPKIAAVLEQRKEEVKEWGIARLSKETVPVNNGVNLYENFDWYGRKAE